MTDEEFYGKYKVRVMKPNERVETFHCGDNDLDDFIINESRAYLDTMIAVTYLVVDKKDDQQVVAYFSLANDKLSVSDFNSNSEFNRFRKRKFIHEKRLRSYPAVKLCRLGVTSSLKGKGVGSILIKFLVTLYLTSSRAGCRFVTVDAYQEAVSFYERNSFVKLSSKLTENTTVPMYFDLKSTYQG